ncbi:MAG: hypothetical protein WCT12_34665 [Verrucomicrobiota bacterium]
MNCSILAGGLEAAVFWQASASVSTRTARHGPKRTNCPLTAGTIRTVRTNLRFERIAVHCATAPSLNSFQDPVILDWQPIVKVEHYRLK